jgi:hypothetical protein
VRRVREHSRGNDAGDPNQTPHPHPKPNLNRILRYSKPEPQPCPDPNPNPSPSQVRFAPCGHAATCRSCAEDLRRSHQPCPSRSWGEVSDWADEGAHVALQTTFVQQGRAPQPQHAPASAEVGGDGGPPQVGRGRSSARGGRGAGGGRRGVFVVGAS